MKRGHRIVRLLACLAAGAALPAQAAESAECDALLADVDARIASGDHPEQNLRIARQMRASFEQMCPMMDPSMRAQLAEGFQQVLPAQAEAGQDAGDRAGAEARRAEREARRAAEREAAERRAGAAPRLPANARGRSIAGQFLDRPEPMYHVYLWDWDVHDGGLRLVYDSRPSREQFGLADWTVNLYYAGMTPSGEVGHRRIRSTQVSDHQALALRRGHDEIVLESKPARDQPVSLERWSTSGDGRLGITDLGDLRADLAGARELRFALATADGHVLYDTTWQNAGSERIAYGWCKVSVTGSRLGCTGAAGPDSVRPWAPFDHPSGGGLLVNVTPVVGSHLQSVDVIAEAEREGANAAVHREKRLLVLDDDGRLAWQAVIERDIMPLAPAANADVPMSDRMAQFEARQRAMVELRTRYDGNRSTIDGNVGLRRVPRVEPTARGAALLTRVSADKSVKHLRGTWLVEVGAGGELNRLHLAPLEAVLDARITMFAPHDDHYYLYAQSRRDGPGTVVRIDAAGEVVDYGTVSAGGDVTIDALEADADGVWLIGSGYVPGAPGRIWVERVVFATGRVPR